MANFYLSEVPGLNFDTIPLMQLRAYYEAGIEDLKSVFYGREEEIEDWANGGWNGRSAMMHAYFSPDEESYRTGALLNFDILSKGMFRREAAELAAALSRRFAA